MLRNVTRTIQGFLFIFVIVLSSPPGRAAVKLDALGAYLVSRGYGGAQLVSSGQFYHLPIVANGKPGHLIVDTGASTSLIFRRSLKRLNLTETKTDMRAAGAFGHDEVFGVTTIATLNAGNCTLANVPVAVADQSASMNSIGRPDGLLGLRELEKFGAVLDLSHRLIYLRPSRPDPEVATSIRATLEQNHFKAIAFSLTRGHIRVPGKVDDVACHFMVDSGAFLTILDRDFAASAKLGGIPIAMEAHGIGNSSRELKVARFPSLWVGDYQIKQASAAITELDSKVLGRGTNSAVEGLLGVEYLALNSAIIDFVSGTIYLRPRPK